MTLTGESVEPGIHAAARPPSVAGLADRVNATIGGRRAAELAAGGFAPSGPWSYSCDAPIRSRAHEASHDHVHPDRWIASVTQLHAVIGPIVLALVALLAVGAAVLAARGRSPESVEWVRRAILGIVVAEAAIGLALAVRGSSPSEAIHWLYGGVIVVALLVPGALRPDVPAGRRSSALAVGASLAALIAWRLGASG